MKRSLAFRTILLVLSLVLTMIPMFAIGSSAAEAGEWTLVTDASTLAVGDKIVIVASGSNYALGTTQNSNNRAAVSVTKSGNTVTIGSTVQQLTLEAGTTSGTFAFNTGSGYLYAASSGSNYLRTQNALDANGSWKITITSSGVATIKAQGTNTRNLLKKNSSSALFACYSSGQNDVSIYKWVAAATTYNASFVVPDGATVPETINGLGITLPDAVEAPAKYNAQEYEFAGWSTSIVNDTGTAPALLAPGASVTLSADTTYYATYKYKAGEETTKVNVFISTPVADIQSTDVVVIAIKQSDGSYYAMSNDKGTSAAPTAVRITVSNNQISGTVADNIKWNISYSSGNLTIYPKGTTAKWLYCTATNNGVRVGTNTDNKTFTIDPSSGYLKNTGTSRYLGVYSSQDWRCYTNTTGNTKDQTLCFFVEKSETTTVVSYNYTTTLEVGCTHENTTTVDTATCTEAGTITVTCDDCEAVISTGASPAIGHNYGGDGICTGCGISNHTCNYVATVTPPTCTEDGYTTYACSCGQSYIDNEVAATGHSYNSCGKCQNTGCDAAAATNVTTNVVIGDYASANEWADATKYTEIVLNEIITATVTGGGNTGKYYENGYNWRLYQTDDATLTISSDGKIIVSVKITYTSSNTGVLVLNNENIASDTVVEVNSTSITFSVGNSGSATNGQARITAIEVVYVDSAYTHNWGEGVETTAPTCTEDGVMTYTCSVCGDSYTVVIPATGHVDTTTVTVDATCTEDGSETVTCSCGEVVSSKVLNATGHSYKSVVTKPTCVNGGYTTHTCSGCGDSYVDSETEITDHNYKSEVTKASNCTETGITTYTCSVCGDSYTEEIPTNGRHVYDENSYVVTKEPTCTEKGEKKGVCTLCETEGRLEIPMIDHSFVDGACEVCGLVDSAIVDYSGRYYIAGIRSGENEKTYRYICGILTDSTTKRYSLVDSGSEDIPSGVFASQADGMLTFVITKCDDGSYVIYVEGVDGDVKYLGWDSVKADNNGILVTEAEALHLAITVNNNGLYNLTFVDGGGNTRYLALNNTVNNAYAAWYKAGNQIQNLALIPIVEEAVIAGAQLNIGTDLTMKYHVALAEDANISDYFMRFTINGESFDVYNYTVVNGKYVFAFSGIVPQCMGDNILAEVLLIDSETVVAVKDNYSIKAYADRMLDKYSDNAELAQLLRDLLKYGAEAQKYRGHNTDNLVSTGAPGYSETTPTEADMNRSLTTADGKTTDNVSFTAAGVRFDYVNNIYVKIKTDDVENVKVVVNGLTELELLETGTAGVYVAYSGGISALDFAEVVTFTVYYNGELIQTLTYTVNSYACDKYEDANIGNLVTALYNYGKSAVAYAEANK